MMAIIKYRSLTDSLGGGRRAAAECLPYGRTNIIIIELEKEGIKQKLWQRKAILIVLLK